MIFFKKEDKKNKTIKAPCLSFLPTPGHEICGCCELGVLSGLESLLWGRSWLQSSAVGVHWESSAVNGNEAWLILPWATATLFTAGGVWEVKRVAVKKYKALLGAWTQFSRGCTKWNILQYAVKVLQNITNIHSLATLIGIRLFLLVMWHHVGEVQCMKSRSRSRFKPKIAMSLVWPWHGCWCQEGWYEYVRNCWDPGISTHKCL